MYYSNIHHSLKPGTGLNPVPGTLKICKSIDFKVLFFTL